MAETTAFIVILEKNVNSEYAEEVAKALRLMVRDCVEVKPLPHNIEQTIADHRAKYEFGKKLMDIYDELVRGGKTK